jgi:primosomal protein N''
LLRRIDDIETHITVLEERIASCHQASTRIEDKLDKLILK